jgi:hypothetical protein
LRSSGYPDAPPDLQADHHPSIHDALLRGYLPWVQDCHVAADFHDILAEWVAARP